MFSVLPGLIAFLFLFYGLYVVFKKGINPVSTSFLILCITTFFWQFTWAVLFQVENEKVADILIRIGWLLILFLPTSLYHFLSESSKYRQELSFVYLSYGFSGILCLLLLFTNLIIDGAYQYFWGFYPKAGSLHFVHILQTVIVVNRALYITYRKSKIVQAGEKTRLNYCMAGIFIYFFAAVDYSCNYGVEIYPPGVIFIAVALAIFAVATVKHHIMDGAMVIAASIAHELRTPLATVNLQSKLLSTCLPQLIEGYNKAAEYKLINALDKSTITMLEPIGDTIRGEVERASQAIDMLLATVGDEDRTKTDFRLFSIKDCVEKAVRNYPYNSTEERIVSLDIKKDFNVLASEELLIYVFNNLINNALCAIKEKGGGRIHIVVDANTVEVHDEGTGISSEILPHIFDNFFTTKNQKSNAGVGLAFCRKTMHSFGGDIKCESQLTKYTKFTLSFKTPTSRKRASGKA